ncbi:hypothetical protein PH586_16420, partial [Pseudomonas sp. SA3-5]
MQFLVGGRQRNICASCNITPIAERFDRPGGHRPLWWHRRKADGLLRSNDQVRSADLLFTSTAAAPYQFEHFHVGNEQTAPRCISHNLLQQASPIQPPADAQSNVPSNGLQEGVGWRYVLINNNRRPNIVAGRFEMFSKQ